MTDRQPSNVTRFPRKRRRSSKNAGLAKGQMHAVPLARHSKVVASIASEMRKLQSKKAEDYLIEFLWIEAGRLADIGIPDLKIELACHAFARAVWAIVLRDHNDEGVA